ncbi:hypothetical protein C8Q74DRAFT_1316591 [Fomes fomentarius]|nr:hypothetical protein C8Q74DRAFT_1316591 [Fomes fomentarius]
MREVCPGILATSQLTENHPLVNTYLDVLARIMPRAPSKLSASSASSPVHPSAALASATNSTSAAIPAPGVITYWQSEQGGIASWNTVSNLISQQFQLFPGHISRLYAAEVPKLTTAQQQSIFALAALKVLNHPTHPAHFALWAKNVILRTADTVDAVIQMRPSPIMSRVGWIGKQENLWALRGLQSMYIPPEPKGMTLRKRKPAPTSTVDADMTEEPAETRVNTRKRTRATRASQRAKEAEAARAAAATPEVTEVAEVADVVEEAEMEEEQESSLLFDPGEHLAPPPFVCPSGPTLEFITRAVKEDLIAGSPVLQAIELMLGLNQPSTDFPLDLPPPAVSSPDHAAESSATRRSTRARRKPAPPGPCSLLSTPLSSNSRSRSRGSSTAVSEADCPSEDGTVVDVEIEPVTSGKGKRKAAEIEEVTVVELEEPAPAPRSGSKAKKSQNARKRVKAETLAVVKDVLDAGVLPDASGDENVPAMVSAPISKKRKAATSSSGKRKPARARA